MEGEPGISSTSLFPQVLLPVSEGITRERASLIMGEPLRMGFRVQEAFRLRTRLQPCRKCFIESWL
jgi:hypothetical protein